MLPEPRENDWRFTQGLDYDERASSLPLRCRKMERHNGVISKAKLALPSRLWYLPPIHASISDFSQRIRLLSAPDSPAE